MTTSVAFFRPGPCVAGARGRGLSLLVRQATHRQAGRPIYPEIPRCAKASSSVSKERFTAMTSLNMEATSSLSLLSATSRADLPCPSLDEP